MTGRGSTIAPRAGAVVAGLCAMVVVVGCDRPAAQRWIPPASSATPLRVVSSNVSEGTIAAHDVIRLRFDRPLDTGSVGQRSVRLARASGRRVPYVLARADGHTLLVSSEPGRGLPGDGPLTLRIEGAGSPRALRAVDGASLRDAWTATFDVVPRRRVDLVTPRLVASDPVDGAADVPPAGHLVLRFDEPLSRASLRTPGAVVLWVDGEARPAALRLSADLTRVVVRPRRPFPSGVQVEVRLASTLHDLAGNALDPIAVSFRTRATGLHELAEDFVTTDMEDPAATTGGWAEPTAPGFLIPRAGPVRWSPAAGDDWDRALEPAAALRFQVVLPGEEAPVGGASALRLTFRDASDGDELLRAFVEAGAVSLQAADPTFEGNRAAAQLGVFARVDVPLEFVAARESDVHTVDIPFERPLALRPGENVLLDVYVEIGGSGRLAAALDTSRAALVDGDPGLLPAAELLVSGGPPEARSTWFDTAVRRPAWREALVAGSHPAGAPGFRVEYQTAAADGNGHPDMDRAGDWTPRLSDAPSLRFVRFRVTFDGLGLPGRVPHIDRVVLPYEE